MLLPTLRWAVGNYFAPGLDRDDLMQEALIGLAQACEDFRTDRGSGFRNFAGMAAQRRVLTAVRAATRQKHRHLNRSIGLDAPVSAGEDLVLADLVEDRHQRPPEEVLALRDELALISKLPTVLSELEQAALAGVVDGRSYEEIAAAQDTGTKQVDNALQRARRKATKVWTGEPQPPLSGKRRTKVSTDTLTISSPVEALDTEIERVKERLLELEGTRALTVEMLEEVAAVLNGSTPEAVKPPPEVEKPPSKPKPAKQVKGTTSASAAAERWEELHELLKRQGPMTKAEMSKTTGWSAQMVRTALGWLIQDDRAHATGQKRSSGGPPSEEFAAGGDASPEPPAAASTTDGAAAASEVVEVGDEERNLDNSSDVSAQAEDLDVTDATVRDEFDWPEDDPPATVPPRAAEPPDVAIREYREPTKNRSKLDEQTAQRIEDAIGEEALTIPEIVAATGLSRGRVMGMLNHLKRLGRVDQRGVSAEQKPKYRRRRRPAEDPTVTVTQAPRTGSVEDRVMFHLSAENPGGRGICRLTIEQLAAKVVLHPRLVAEAVSELKKQGLVEKIEGGRYQLVEQGRAAA